MMLPYYQVLSNYYLLSLFSKSLHLTGVALYPILSLVFVYVVSSIIISHSIQLSCVVTVSTSGCSSKCDTDIK